MSAGQEVLYDSDDRQLWSAGIMKLTLDSSRY
jgi:hypothetical protein